MGHHQGGETEPLMDVADIGGDRLAGHRIERAERLVQQQDRRAEQPAPGPGRRAAAGRRTIPAADGSRMPPCSSRTRARSSFTRASISGGIPAQQARGDGDVLRHRHVRKKASFLKDIADATAQQDRVGIQHVLALDPDRRPDRARPAG